MRTFYSVVLYLSVPVVILKLLIKGIKNPDYWQRIPERFGFKLDPLHNINTICIHAVSVGEVNATKPIVTYLLDHYPDYTIVITTMTPTGAETVNQNYGERVVHYYLPYDLPDATERFVQQIQPKIFIVMETEIWPNLFCAFYRKRIPVLLLNARMSEKSATGYQRLGRFTKEILKMIERTAAQTEADAQRLIGLGVERDKIEITGSLKFDIPSPQSIIERGQSLRQYLSANRPVWIAASTHEGEEKMVLDAFKKIQSGITHCLLIIAPRHIERVGNVVELCNKLKFSCVKKSESQFYSNETEVYILDTLGELTAYYAAVDIAFVGGSLVPVGGHNILEPVSVGVPTITGPYTHNFAVINEQLQEMNVVCQITNSDDLSRKVSELFNDANLRHATGEKGKQYIEQNRGSAKKVLSMIEKTLSMESFSREAL